MKNLLTALLLLVSVTCFAQSSDSTRHVPFASVSSNYTPGLPLSFGAEAGIWGTKANTSYAATFDVMPNGRSETAYYLGAKLYYTVFNSEKLQYMVYVSPKARLNAKEGMLEYAFNPYYTLCPNALLGVAVGQQVTRTGTNTFGGLSLVYLFR